MIVSRSFFPEQSPRSFRTTELAKELIRQGHEVTVLTIDDGVKFGDIQKEIGCKIERKLNPRYAIIQDINNTQRGLFTRIKDRFLFRYLLFPEIELAFLIKNVLKNDKRHFDELISIAKPYSVHFGCALALKHNSKLTSCWVADCGDPLTGSKNGKKIYPIYWRWIEHWMFRNTNYITIPVESARKAYPIDCNNKIKIIPQGFNFRDVRLWHGLTQNSRPTFAYAGAFYSLLRDPSAFLDLLGKRNDSFKFVVYSHTANLLKPYLPLLKDRLELRNPIPRKDLLYELSKMDFLVNFENISDEMVPSKVIDYHLTGRPVLNLKPNNLDIDNIERFLRGDYSNKFIIVDIEKYEISNVAKAFVDLCQVG